MKRQFNVYIDDEVIKKAREKLDVNISKYIEDKLKELAEINNEEKVQFGKIENIEPGEKIVRTIVIDQNLFKAVKKEMRKLGKTFSYAVEQSLREAFSGMNNDKVKTKLCKICNSEVEMLLEHLKSIHNMTMTEYVKMFGKAR